MMTLVLRMWLMPIMNKMMINNDKEADDLDKK